MSSPAPDASLNPSPPASPAVAALAATSSDPVSSSRGGTPPASMSGSLTLGDIKEGEALVVEEATVDSDSEGELEEGNMTESVLFPVRATTPPSAATPSASAEGATPAADASASLPTPPPSARSEAKPQAASETPITKIVEDIEALSQKEQDTITSNLERLGTYPSEMPLSASWTLHFSDTAQATKASSHGATKDQYTEAITPLFTVDTVPGLCGSLKAYKRLVRSKRSRPGPDTMGLSTFRAGQNLHFFRAGVSPTWEDPWNEKGGRLTISPSPALFDSTFERIVLLLAGSALEAATTDILNGPAEVGAAKEGLIIGVVASRRARGDRIELWLGGKEKRSSPPMDWIDVLKGVLSDELEMPELRHGKWKKHF